MNKRIFPPADSSGVSIPMPARQRSRMTPQATS